MEVIAVVVLFIVILVLNSRLQASREERVAGSSLKVVDGDTVELNGAKLRLQGIDAPEWNQEGGRDAADHLRRLLRRAGDLTIAFRGRDRYGRELVTLRAENGTDLNARMVEDGQAIAYRRYDARYTELMNQAWRQRRGIWATANFRSPEQFRHY